jgi:hypothetical protein
MKNHIKIRLMRARLLLKEGKHYSMDEVIILLMDVYEEKESKEK